MNNKFLISFEEYVDTLYKNSKLDKNSIENIINTQIALLFSNLAVKNESNCFLGKLYFEDGEIKIKPNDLIEDLLQGKIDPVLILKEMLDNE